MQTAQEAQAIIVMRGVAESEEAAVVLKAQFKIEGLSEPVEVGGVWMNSNYSLVMTPSEDDVQPAYRMEFEVRDGAPQLRAVHVEATDHGRGIRRSDLRFSVDDYIEDVTKWAAAASQHNPGGVVDPSTLDPAFIRGLREVRRTERRVAPTDADLATVAEVYRSVPGAGAKAVRDHFDIAARTASYWVKRAREAGYLAW